MDVGTADKIKRLHMLPDTAAPYMLGPGFVKGLIRRCMAEENVMDGLLHFFHRAVQHVIYLLVGHLERGAERGRI